LNFEIIAEQKVLADPFLGKSVRISNNNFTSRLLADGTSKQNTREKQRPHMPLGQLKYSTSVVNNHSDQAPKMPRQVERKFVIEKEKKNIVPAPELDKENTLPGKKVLLDSSPDDMTNGSSSESSSTSRSNPRSARSKSVESESGQQDGWDVVLRPHYSNLSDAIHRIADVSNDCTV